MSNVPVFACVPPHRLIVIIFELKMVISNDIKSIYPRHDVLEIETLTHCHSVKFNTHEEAKLAFDEIRRAFLEESNQKLEKQNIFVRTPQNRPKDDFKGSENQ